MKSKRVLIVATVLSHIAQFHRPLADMLRSHGFEIHVAANDNLSEKNGLKLDWADKIYNIPLARSPKSPQNFKAYRFLKEIITNGNYTHVHCNTPMGGIITRLAARTARKNGCEVIYTAHGFHFHKGSSKLAWLIYYPIERLFAHLTDKLITINHEDYQIADNKFNCKCYYTHGVGVNSDRYVPLKYEQERIELCSELNIDPTNRIILAIGELLPNKNQQMAITAMKTVVESVPNSHLIIAGNGPYREVLLQQIKDLSLENNITLIGYCTILEKYQKIAELLVACSYREGLPLNLVEAMLAGNPIVASINRGHRELIKDNINGFLVNINDSGTMAEKIIMILTDKTLRKSLADQARNIGLKFSSENVKKELERVYDLSKS